MTGAGLSKGNVCISLLSRRKEKYWSTFHVHSTALELLLLSSSQICPRDKTNSVLFHLDEDTQSDSRGIVADTSYEL